MESSPMEFSFIDEDPVVPVSIDHRCEEIFDSGKLDAKYDFIVYHFECDGAYVWARSYLDRTETVSVYGPFESRDSLKETGGKFNEAMLGYLRRRFKYIEAMVHGEGYVQIWP
jgi:hypothetical protein